MAEAAATADNERLRAEQRTPLPEGTAGDVALEPDPLVEAAAAKLLREAKSWQLPTSPSSAKARAIALLHVEKMLPILLEAHENGGWSEHRTSGLLDRADCELPPRSAELCARLRERLFHFALGEYLEQEGCRDLACCAYARGALVSNGCAELYHHWAECLKAEGRQHDVLAVHRIAVKQGVWQHLLQRPNDLYVPGLRAQPFWGSTEIPAVRELESAYPAILREYRALEASAERGLWTKVTDWQLVATGAWTDFKLIENGKQHPVNCSRCPETMRIIQERCPEIATQIRGSIIFSRLAPGTMITPHCGPTNTRIRIHLGLEVPEPRPWIRVGREWRTWEPGRCLVFDDSFEHEVVHRGDRARVVLIADLWHTDFGQELRERHLHGRHLRRYRSAAPSQPRRRSYEPHRVDPVEVRFLEDLLKEMPEVREAAATMHLDDKGLQTLVMYVECASLALEPSAVCDRCGEKVRGYGVGALVLAVREWPRGPSGDIDRARLPPPPLSLLEQ